MGETREAERALVRSMLAGEDQAFNTFFDTYFARIYRFALPRLNGDVEACKEVVQATLVKAIHSLGGFRGDAALFTWICQICRRQIVDRVRAEHRHARNEVLLEDTADGREAMEAAEAPRDQEPMQQYGTAETRRLVQAILDRLPGRYGDILEWKYVEGRSVEEIGELLGVGQVAAQSMLARARAAFRKAVEDAFGAKAAEVLSVMR